MSHTCDTHLRVFSPLRIFSDLFLKDSEKKPGTAESEENKSQKPTEKYPQYHYFCGAWKCKKVFAFAVGLSNFFLCAGYAYQFLFLFLKKTFFHAFFHDVLSEFLIRLLVYDKNLL